MSNIPFEFIQDTMNTLNNAMNGHCQTAIDIIRSITPNNHEPINQQTIRAKLENAYSLLRTMRNHQEVMGDTMVQLTQLDFSTLSEQERSKVENIRFNFVASTQVIKHPGKITNVPCKLKSKKEKKKKEKEKEKSKS